MSNVATGEYKFPGARIGGAQYFVIPAPVLLALAFNYPGACNFAGVEIDEETRNSATRAAAAQDYKGRFQKLLADVGCSQPLKCDVPADDAGNFQLLLDELGGLFASVKDKIFENA